MRVWTSVIGQRLEGAENTRSMLMCSELLRRGHEVVMWTSAYDHIRKKWRDQWLANGMDGYRRDDGLEVRFMKGCGYSRNVSVRRLVDHHLAARSFFEQAQRLPRPDAIVASLPDHVTAAMAVRFGREHQIPTLVDVRDKWPDILLDYIANPALHAVAKLGLARERARASRALRDTDSIVTMMQSLMDWSLMMAGNEQPGPRDRIFYLTPFPQIFDVEQPQLPADSKVLAALAAAQDRVVFALVGTFNRLQHPSLLFDALDRLNAQDRRNGAPFTVIIGGGGIDEEEIRRRAAQYDNVHHVGWLSSAEISVLLSRSHVGLIPVHYPTPVFNNKSFSYLASGLPIINGGSGDLVDIINKQRAGINVPPGDAGALAAAIRELADNAALRAEMSANVKRLFLSRFDRDSNYRAYVDHIERVAADVGRGKRAG
jgi:glycosyltransferase involved in cell wall biosynthesis